ncbi:hypothetical protein IR073_06455 [Gemella sp. 19428wG2_WT2a]|nr:hypothetical protein [Gemella sp. 19428wG2_WT2a]TFU57677.1 hypothetical protein E4T67_06380 [Gemella sp. WT2a]
MVKINEMIEFVGFNSKEHNLYLINRDAPSPQEKEIVEDIPFKQGVLDFSMILGERIFKNREITYEFLLLDNDYSDRSRFETILKRELMPFGKNKLYDSHDSSYFWLGKCKSVEVEHDNKFDKLIATIVFDCYPFMFSLKKYFDDVWDSFDFNDGVASFTKYIVNGKKEIILVNNGTNAVKSEVKATSNMTIMQDKNKRIVNKSLVTSIVLNPGLNKIVVQGEGIISFHWTSEVLA